MRNYNKHPLRIFIGVGHGGSDSGAVNKTLGLTEAGINLTIALLMERDLKRHGVQVLLSRYTDQDDRLKEEIAECNAYNPDFALEIHTNAGGGTGFEVYYQLEPWEHSKLSLEMAKRFDTNVQTHFGVKTRGIKTNRNLGWLSQVQAPCILVENFFIDGERAAWYAEPAQLKRFAKAYVCAILDYYCIAWVADNSGCQMVKYQVLSENSAKECVSRAVLIDGNWYVHLRHFSQNLGKDVHYDNGANKITVYSPEDYKVSETGFGLLRIRDYETRLDRVMAGIE